MTIPQFHVRNIESDSFPEIVWEAIERNSSPAFIAREGFLQCPRCARYWPADHYKEGHDTVESWRPQARCLSCRRGANHALRQKAIRTGVCEARGCENPIGERYKCDLHRSRAAGAYAARDGAPAPRRTPRPGPAAPAPRPAAPAALAPRPVIAGQVPTPRLMGALAGAK